MTAERSAVDRREGWGPRCSLHDEMVAGHSDELQALALRVERLAVACEQLVKQGEQTLDTSRRVDRIETRLGVITGVFLLLWGAAGSVVWYAVGRSNSLASTVGGIAEKVAVNSQRLETLERERVAADEELDALRARQAGP